MTEADTFLTQRDLARRWQISTRTLERWRQAGNGPDWLMIGKSIRYRMQDVVAHEAAHMPSGGVTT